MSAMLGDMAPATGAGRRLESEPVTTARATAAEWIKFKTLRSTWSVLLGAVLAMVVIGLVVAYNTRHLSANLQANDVAPSATLQGYYLAQLLVGALGVLFVSGEYSTGMIRSTFAAVPRRVPVVWAKLMVFVAVVLTTLTATSFVAFGSAQGLISHYRAGWSLSQPGVLRVVIGTAIYLTVLGVIGGAVGWIVRSTPGALVAFVSLVLILPVLFGNVLGHLGQNIGKFLPSSAGAAFIDSIPDGYHLTQWWGLAVMLAWAVLGVVAAVVLLRRRDA